MSLTRLGYELRALGVGPLGIPILAILIFAGVAALAGVEAGRQGASPATSHDDTALGLLFLLEAGLPLVAGLGATYVISNNPAKELHLSLPTTYPNVMATRLLLFTLWAALISGCVSASVGALGYWFAPQLPLEGALVWGAPLLWFIAIGALLSLALGSWSASCAALGVVWVGAILLRAQALDNAIAQQIYPFLTIFDAHAPYWLSNRLTLLGVAVVALVAALLRRGEATLAHEA